MGESKKNGYKGFKIFIILFLVVSMIFLKKENQNEIIKFFDSFSSKEKELRLVDSFQHNGDINSISIFEGNIIRWTNNKLSFMKTDGTIVLEKEFNFTEPFIYYGEKYIYVMDKSTGDIYSLDKNGETKDRLQLNKEVFNIKEINQNLIYHIKTANGESINILDKDRVLIGNHSFEDKNILTYTTNGNGNKNAISLLDLNDQILKSQILFFGENKEALGSLNIEGEIIVYIGYTSTDEMIALTDNALYSIKDSKIMWRKQFDLITDIYIEDKIYILYGSSLETINLDGRTENKIGLTEEYNEILPFEGKVLLYGDNNIVLVEGDKQILKYNEDIMGVSVSNRQLVLWGPKEIKTYRIANKR